MKKNLFAVISSALFAIATYNNASAQEFKNGDVARLNVAPGSSSSASTATAMTLSSKAGSKAFKDFSKKFKAISNAEWIEATDGGFIASFTSNASPTRAFYNQDGQFEYSLTRYTVEKMPANILRSVKNAFDGYRVICAEEVNVEGKTIYLVHIQSFTNSKTVRVTDSDMEVIEELLHS